MLEWFFIYISVQWRVMDRNVIPRGSFICTIPKVAGGIMLVMFFFCVWVFCVYISTISTLLVHFFENTLRIHINYHQNSHIFRYNICPPSSDLTVAVSECIILIFCIVINN